MAQYNTFLEIIKTGWEGNIRSNDIENPNPPKSLMWPTLDHSPQKFIIQQNIAKRVDTKFKVNNNGIVINVIYNDTSMMLCWGDILKASKEIYVSSDGQKEISIELKDGKEIIITPPFVKKLWIKFYFSDELVDYINEHIDKI